MDGIQGRFLKSKSGSVAFKVQSWYEGTKATSWDVLQTHCTPVSGAKLGNEVGSSLGVAQGCWDVPACTPPISGSCRIPSTDR